MWFSFSTNILTFLCSAVLFQVFSKQIKEVYFSRFILLTGVGAGIAAFGHLDILPQQWQSSLLLLSRILNFVSIFYFSSGTIRWFGYEKIGIVKISSTVVFIVMSGWLIYLNILWPGAKLSFIPVIVYGVVGMLFIGSYCFIINLKQNMMAHIFVLTGVLILAISAVIFKLMPMGSMIDPVDISHLLITLSLFVMTYGFKNMGYYDIKK